MMMMDEVDISRVVKVGDKRLVRVSGMVKIL